MGQEDESLDRLETALERIARKVEEPDAVATEVAGRLDAVIARLRAGLAAPDAGHGPGGHGEE